MQEDRRSCGNSMGIQQLQIVTACNCSVVGSSKHRKRIRQLPYLGVGLGVVRALEILNTHNSVTGLVQLMEGSMHLTANDT